MLNSALTNRREFLKTTMAATAISCLPFTAKIAGADSSLDFPLEDLHVHLTPQFTLDDVKTLSEKTGVKCGIVQHPGGRYRNIGVNDEDMQKYIDMLAQYPVYKGVQPVSPNWKDDFTEKTLSQLDYVIMDAMELPNKDIGFLCILMDDTKIENKQKFMDRYVDYYQYVMSEESIDILASSTFLPMCLRNEYDDLWTEKRVQTLIDCAIKNNVAVELNSLYKIPHEKFIRMAKEAGVKFTFGTNGRTTEVAAHLDYSIAMAKKFAISKQDMYSPRV